MSGKVAWITIKTAARNFGRDNVMILSAALAFFSMLSLAPLLVLLLTITGWLGQDTQQRVVERAAGSLAVLLLWMFYSAIVVLVGAELTHAYVSCCGKQVTPDRHAEPTEEAVLTAREQGEMAHSHAD